MYHQVKRREEQKHNNFYFCTYSFFRFSKSSSLFISIPTPFYLLSTLLHIPITILLAFYSNLISIYLLIKHHTPFKLSYTYHHHLSRLIPLFLLFPLFPLVHCNTILCTSLFKLPHSFMIQL
jgi:hypothetical protein